MRIIGLLCDGRCIIGNALAHKMYEYRMLPMRMKPTRKQVNYVQIGICICPNLLALISFDFKFYGLFLWWVTRTTITSHIVDNSVYGSI